MELLAKGKNVLAARVRSDGDCAFDISLDAMPKVGD